MASERDSFLRRVRQAVAEGNRAGGAGPLPARGEVGYQGAGADPVARFCAELTAAGGQAHVVRDRAGVLGVLLPLIQARSVRRVLLGRNAFLEGLNLADAVRTAGVEVIEVSSLTEPERRPAFFNTDLGLSGVDYLIAETGSVVLGTAPDQPRSLSLLPPVHVAIAHRGQILPDLFDLFETHLQAHPEGMPSALSLITGPSKTGDIELKLVTGVHGPGEIHVIVVDALPPAGC